MKLAAHQLTQHLQRTLLPVYLVSGDEPLQTIEACRAIRQASQRAGFTERVVLEVTSQFNWQQFQHACQHVSLFDTHKLIELRSDNAKFGKLGSSVLQHYLQQARSDIVLLISCGKLDSSQQRSAWFKALSQVGAVIQVWPIERNQLPRWIAQRAEHHAIRLSTDATALLVSSCEGNLLACAQLLEKLALLFPKGTTIDVSQLADCISNHQHYDVFNLVDAVLAADASQALFIIDHLHQVGMEPAIVLWALARETRILLELALGKQVAGLWPKRQQQLQTCLQRHTIDDLQQILKCAHHIDCIIKGITPGDTWIQLINLSLKLSGITMGIADNAA
ncbi:MAG: DNA polymerase III subunit delta [Gammaproteobacteria bacterium]